MNLDCRLPSVVNRPLSRLLRDIDEDPIHDHYSPCEIASALARHYVVTFVTGAGTAMLELTDEGIAYLKEHTK